MQPDFWHSKWEKREIAFHEGSPNKLLTKHFDSMQLDPKSRIFVPLCGKTRDIGWFLERGHRVAGAELNESAVKELFEELDVTPKVTARGPLKHYSADELEVFVGNVFDLSSEYLGAVDAVYDRAAMVALPQDMRARYAAHLVRLTHSAPQFVITFSYDQSKMSGPPFSVPHDELEGNYTEHYRLEILESREIEGGLKGVVQATETVHRLWPKS